MLLDDTVDIYSNGGQNMKIGKLPEPVLIRSVLKQVGHRRNEVLV